MFLIAISIVLKKGISREMDKNPYSFTQKVKEELTDLEGQSDERIIALLSAYIRINGKLIIRKNKTIVTLTSKNGKVAKFIYTQLMRMFDIECHLSYQKKAQLDKKISYTISVIENAEEVLEKLKISFLEGKIDKTIVASDDSIAGYLAGAFLAAGSINSPTTSNYHLEISVNYENYAHWLAKLFPKSKANLDEPKIAKRRHNFVIYFKKSNQIAYFLIVIGAVNSCMEFENFRADRDLFNSLNRVSNFDVANMRRTVESAARQVEEIKIIDQKLGIDNIKDERIRIACKIRLENESASYKELAKVFSEYFNKPYSKSSINHIYRAVHELYGRLANGN